MTVVMTTTITTVCNVLLMLMVNDNSNKWLKFENRTVFAQAWTPNMSLSLHREKY